VSDLVLPEPGGPGAWGPPLTLLVTAGQRNDSPQFQPILEAFEWSASGRAGHVPGRTRCAPTKAYGSRANRTYPRRRELAPLAPRVVGTVAPLGSRRGNLPSPMATKGRCGCSG
jgi:hypothetical protein